MKRVLIVSNRLPVAVTRQASGEFEVRATSGGLATGLAGVHGQGESLWIGWPGIADDALTDGERAQLAAHFAGLRVVGVPLAAAELSAYYEDFCNGILWPLFHYLTGNLPAEFRGFEEYQAINRRFADAVVAQYRDGDTVWVHDYQLLLVPRLVREQLPEARIGFFLHIPFPSSDVFRMLPFRDELLEGLLGADLIGFHTAAYLRHFASSVLRSLGASTEMNVVQWGHRQVRLGVFPMGIDAGSWVESARNPAVLARAAELRGDRPGHLLVGIDRLDYTKGIPRRMLAFERLLERHPELRGQVRLIQCAVPSRTNVEAYQSFRGDLDALIGRIVGRFSTPDSVPVHYIARDLPFEELVALYRAADVMLVTPLRDGMNLVAKEFAASRVDEDGVLVLSEFAGAASELAEAVTVNPYDIEGTAEAIFRALVMPQAERRSRMRVLRRRVLRTPVQAWAAGFVEALGGPAERWRGPQVRTSWRVIEELVAQARAAPRLVVLTDYDGTLVPFARAPELARPDGEALALLQGLCARPRTEVHVVSGRDRATLLEWLGHLPIGLHGEHGFWSRPPGEDGPGQEAETLGNLDWKEPLRAILEDYTARTPGSLLEEKPMGFAWHYRAAEPDFGQQQAGELHLYVAEMFSNAPVEVLHGAKVVEVRPQGIHKGRVAAALAQRQPDATLLALGDDRTDEDLFAALPEGRGLAIHVGPGASAAPYRVDGVRDVREILRRLALP